MSLATSSRFSSGAARFATLAAGIALLALALLHVVRPDLSPRSRMISEYAVGPYGSLMTLSFAGFASSCWALTLAAFPHVKGVTARFGLGFLALAGIGAAIGGAFTMDPSTNDPNKMSFSGHMHGLGFMIGVPSELLSVLLIAIAARKVDAWSAPTLGILAALVWASLVAMVPLMFAGHDFGVPNRLFMVFFGLFVIVAARALERPRAASSPYVLRESE